MNSSPLPTYWYSLSEQPSQISVDASWCAASGPSFCIAHREMSDACPSTIACVWCIHAMYNIQPNSMEGLCDTLLVVQVLGMRILHHVWWLFAKVQIVALVVGMIERYCTVHVQSAVVYVCNQVSLSLSLSLSLHTCLYSSRSQHLRR
jgi:hypothetical protein